MSSLIQVILFSLVGGVLSLGGAMLLISSKKRAKKIATFATPFAAGALLAAAFLDLLKEAAHEGDVEVALKFALVGVLVFFLLERFLHWFHHHHEHEGGSKAVDPTVSLIVIGDTLHNFIDGIAIAAGFLVDPSTGIVVTLAVAAHEIPQEIGDVGLMLQKGMAPKNVIKVNAISALATTLSAVIFFQLGTGRELPLDIILGLVAGFFIYIATSDIIPSIHSNEKKQVANAQTWLLIAGVLVVGLATNLLHDVIEKGSGHESHDTHSEMTHEEATDGHQHGSDGFEVMGHNELPSVSLGLHKDAKAGYNLHIETTNFTFTPESVNAENVSGEGHAHVYVNDVKISRVYGPYIHLPKVAVGDEVKVTLNVNDHSAYMHDGESISAELIAE